METGGKLESLDVAVPAVPFRTRIPLIRPRMRTVPDEEAVRERAAPPQESAAAEFYCAQCRYAKVDRMRSLCLCTSISSEFARRQVFSGQEACGWFEQRGRRSPVWPLFSARKL